MSDDRALALSPLTLRHRPGLQLVLHRGSRQLIALDQSHLRLRVLAAFGTEGLETTTGEHQVLFKTFNPVSKWNRFASCIAWSVRAHSSCNRWSSGPTGPGLSSIPTDFDGEFRRSARRP